MRHVSRTQRVALDWLFDRIKLDPKIQIKYVDTKNQLAGVLTKGSFSRDEWNHLMCSFNIMSFSTHSWSHFKSFLSQATERLVIGAMSKRAQDTTSSDGSPVAKARPTNLVMHSQCQEDVSPHRSGSLVNPVNDDNRKWVGLTSGNWRHPGQSEKEYNRTRSSLAIGNCVLPVQTPKMEVFKCIDKRRLI